MQVFIWLHRIAMQLNFFSNYKLDSENFRCRDFICTYIYVIICIILSVIYSMYFFSNDFVNWNCQITINNTCSIDEFKGGGGCCAIGDGGSVAGGEGNGEGGGGIGGGSNAWSSDGTSTGGPGGSTSSPRELKRASS